MVTLCLCVESVCFVRKRELTCKVRVCELDAKTTHPVLFFIEIHRVSGSGLGNSK